MTTSTMKQAASATQTIRISEPIYRKLGAELRECIGTDTDYTGTVEYTNGAFTGQLEITLFAYFRRITAPDGCWDQLYDVVPIWWEFHSYYDDGEECANDFEFDKLKEYVIPYTS